MELTLPCALRTTEVVFPKTFSISPGSRDAVSYPVRFLTWTVVEGPSRSCFTGIIDRVSAKGEGNHSVPMNSSASIPAAVVWSSYWVASRWIVRPATGSKWYSSVFSSGSVALMR